MRSDIVYSFRRNFISSEERGTFKIRDTQLKAAIAKSFGKAPTDAYLHSNTPWGDLYKTYNWPQTQTVVNCISAEIVGITSEPMVLKNQMEMCRYVKTGVIVKKL